MGIPTFFPWLEARYPQMVQSTESIPTVDNLYFDMDDLLYACSEGMNTMKYVIPYQRPPRDFEYLWIDLTRYLEVIVSILRPKKLLYLSFDGYAPMAKMRTNRERNFLTEKLFQDYIANQRKMNGEIIDPYFSPAHTDFACDFGLQLSKYIKKYVKKKMREDPNWQKIQVIYSGCDVVGEGEHKIQRYIRCTEFPPNTRHCIVGKDADWIILGLISHLPYVFIVRTPNTPKFSYPPRKESELMKFKVLFINILREYFIEEFKELEGLDIDRYVDDFAIFTMFLGNDFLPRVPTFEIRNNVIDDFIKIYKRLWREIGYISYQGSIIWNSFTVLVSEFKELEVSYMMDIIEKRQIPEVNDCISDLDSEDEAYMHVALDRVKALYYRYHMKIEQDAPIIQKMCENFLQGILWMSSYYYENEFDMNWEYPFDFSPMVSDVSEYLRTNGPVSLNSSHLPPTSQLGNLACLLPQSLTYLFPKECRPVREQFDEFLSCLPEFHYDLFSTVKDFTTETLVLPHINIHEVMRSLNEIDDTPEIIKKNRVNTEKLYTFEENKINKNDVFIDISQNLTRTMPEYRERTRFPTLHSLNFASSIIDLPITEKRIGTSRVVLQILPTSYTLQEARARLTFRNIFINYPNKILAEALDFTDSVLDSFESPERFNSYKNKLRRNGIDIENISNIFVTCETLDSCIHKVPIELISHCKKDIVFRNILYPRKPCIILTDKLFGALGEINEVYKDEVKVRVIKRPKYLLKSFSKRSLDRDQFHSFKTVASKLNMSISLTGLLLKTFKVKFQENFYEIGLNLGYFQEKRTILKYTRLVGEDWEISDRAVLLLKHYIKAFPLFFRNLKFLWEDNHQRNLTFEQLFGSFAHPEKIMKEIALFVHKLRESSLPWCSSYYEYLGDSAMKELPEFLKPKDIGQEFIIVDKDQVFTEGKIWTAPDIYESFELKLSDRVVNVCSTNVPFVPFGAPATVITVRNDQKVDVLFDEFRNVTCPLKIMTMPVKHLLKIND